MNDEYEEEEEWICDWEEFQNLLVDYLATGQESLVLEFWILIESFCYGEYVALDIANQINGKTTSEEKREKLTEIIEKNYENAWMGWGDGDLS